MDIDGFGIVGGQEARESIQNLREKGSLQGVYLGFPEFHEKYRMALGVSTEWTGAPGSGKSEYLLECLLNTSLFHGWKHLLYVPDIGRKEIVLSKILQKLTGKTFDTKDKGTDRYITEEEIERHIDWVLHHFKIVFRKSKQKKITPYQFWDWAVELKQKEGLHTATIDSWKDLKRYVGRDGDPIPRDDLYLEDVLEYRNAILEEHDLHFHTVIHPRPTEKDSNGVRKPPHPYDLKGGPTWFDSGKCMITVHRVDGTFNEVRIIVYKAKPETVAELGEVTMFFDKKYGRYYTKSHGVENGKPIEFKIFANKDYVQPINIGIASLESDRVNSDLFSSDEEEDDGMPF